MDAILRLLEPRLPPSVFDILLSAFSLMESFKSYLQTHWDNGHRPPPEDWIGRLLYPETLLPPLSKILPPIISILAIYFTLISLYRTTSVLIRLSLFLIRWMIMFGVVIVALGLGLGLIQPSLITSILNGSFGDETARGRGRRTGEKPKIWDTWEAHQEWKRTRGEDLGDMDTQSQRVMKEIWVAGQNIVEDRGGFLKLVFGDGEQKPAVRKQARTGDSKKGKAKVR